MPKELEDETYVRELFARRFNVELRKLPEADSKTSDFELSVDGERMAVLEVKRLERTPRTPENGWRKEEFFMTRADNGPKRVGGLIHQGWKQLQHYPEPKILVFVNDESGLDVLDLEEAFNGFLPYGTEETGYIFNTASKPIAEGRIKDEKGRIDLYIWIDRHFAVQPVQMVFPAGGEPFVETRNEGPLFRCTSPTGYELARQYFQCPELKPPNPPEALA